MKDIEEILKEKGIKYTTSEKLHAKHMQDPEFRKLWEKDLPRHEFICEIIKARVDNGLTQEELADIIQMKQPAIARIESPDGNPRLSTMQKIAEGLGKKLKITLQ